MAAAKVDTGWYGHEGFVVKVGKGEASNSYFLHRGYACFASKYFDDLYTELRQAIIEVDFSNEPADVVYSFAHWLYPKWLQILADQNHNVNQVEYVNKLLVFAEKYWIHDLAIECYKKVRTLLGHHAGIMVPAERVKLMYDEHGKRSSMMKSFFLRLMVQRFSAQESQSDVQYLESCFEAEPDFATAFFGELRECIKSRRVHPYHDRDLETYLPAPVEPWWSNWEHVAANVVEDKSENMAKSTNPKVMAYGRDVHINWDVFQFDPTARTVEDQHETLAECLNSIDKDSRELFRLVPLIQKSTDHNEGTLERVEEIRVKIKNGLEMVKGHVQRVRTQTNPRSDIHYWSQHLLDQQLQNSTKCFDEIERLANTYRGLRGGDVGDNQKEKGVDNDNSGGGPSNELTPRSNGTEHAISENSTDGKGKFVLLRVKDVSPDKWIWYEHKYGPVPKDHSGPIWYANGVYREAKPDQGASQAKQINSSKSPSVTEAPPPENGIPSTAPSVSSDGQHSTTSPPTTAAETPKNKRARPIIQRGSDQPRLGRPPKKKVRPSDQNDASAARNTSPNPRVRYSDGILSIPYSPPKQAETDVRKSPKRESQEPYVYNTRQNSSGRERKRWAGVR